MSVPDDTPLSSPPLSRDLARATDALEAIKSRSTDSRQNQIMAGHPPVMFGAGGPMSVPWTIYPVQSLIGI